MVKANGKVPALMVLLAGLALQGCGREASSALPEAEEPVETARAEPSQSAQDSGTSLRSEGLTRAAAEAPPAAERPASASTPEDKDGDRGRTNGVTEASPSAAEAPLEKPRVERRIPPVELPTPTFELLPLGERNPAMLIPAGTRIELEVKTTLSSKRAWPGDRFRATVLDDLLDRDGMVLVPLGAVVEGVVTRVERGQGEDDPVLELEAEALITEGEVYEIDARVASVELRTRRIPDGRDLAGKAAAGAAAGAILGKILGKDTKSTIAGAVAGAAAGTAVAAATGDSEVVLEQGAHMEVVLQSALWIRD